MSARCDDLGQRFERAGGPTGMARRVRLLVDAYQSELESCRHPVLCHNDFVDRNVLVTPTGPPRLTGLLDLEHASWDDPLADLARARLHARSRDEVGADALVKAYGLRSEDEQWRLAVHEVLHAVEQRTRLATDRPESWRRSAANLDTFIRSRT